MRRLSTSMRSDRASALTPSSSTTRPLMRTRPSRIIRSAPRREATPARARIFWRRSLAIGNRRRSGILGRIGGRIVGDVGLLRLARLPGLFGLSRAAVLLVAIPTFDGSVAIEIGAHPDHATILVVLPSIGPPRGR